MDFADGQDERTPHRTLTHPLSSCLYRDPTGLAWGVAAHPAAALSPPARRDTVDASIRCPTCNRHPESHIPPPQRRHFTQAQPVFNNTGPAHSSGAPVHPGSCQRPGSRQFSSLESGSHRVESAPLGALWILLGREACHQAPMLPVWTPSSGGGLAAACWVQPGPQLAHRRRGGRAPGRVGCWEAKAGGRPEGTVPGGGRDQWKRATVEQPYASPS